MERLVAGQLDWYASLANYGNEFGEWIEDTNTRWRSQYGRGMPITLEEMMALAGELGLAAADLPTLTRRQAAAYIEGSLKPIPPSLTDAQRSAVVALATLCDGNTSYFTWKQVEGAGGGEEQTIRNYSRYLKDSGWVEKNPCGNGFRIGSKYQVPPRR